MDDKSLSSKLPVGVLSSIMSSFTTALLLREGVGAMRMACAQHRHLLAYKTKWRAWKT